MTSATTTKPLPLVHRTVGRPRTTSTPVLSLASSEYTEVNRVVAHAYTGKTQTSGRPNAPTNTIAPTRTGGNNFTRPKPLPERPDQNQVYSSNDRQFSASMQHLTNARPTTPSSLVSYASAPSTAAEIAPARPRNHGKVMNMPSANKSDGALQLLQPRPSMDSFAGSDTPSYGSQRTFNGYGQVMAKRYVLDPYSPQSEKSSPSPSTPDDDPQLAYREPLPSNTRRVRRRVTPLRRQPNVNTPSARSGQRERRIPSPLPEYDALSDLDESSLVSSYAPTFPTSWNSNRSSNTTITEHEIFPSYKQQQVELPDVDRSPLFTDQEQESVMRYLNRISVDVGSTAPLRPQYNTGKRESVTRHYRTSDYSWESRSQRAFIDNEGVRPVDRNSMVQQQPTNAHMRARLTSGASTVPSILTSLEPSHIPDSPPADLDGTPQDYGAPVKRNSSWVAPPRVQKEHVGRSPSVQRKQRGLGSTDRSMPPLSRGVMLLQSQSTTDLNVISDDGVYRAIMPDIPRSASLRLASTTSLARLEKNIRYRQRAESKSSNAAAAYAVSATRVDEELMEEDRPYHQFSESKVSLTMSVNTSSARLDEGNTRYRQYAESKISLALSVNTSTATRIDGANLDENARYRQYSESKVSLGASRRLEEGYPGQLVEFPSMQTEDDEDDSPPRPRPTQAPLGMQWENPSVRTLTTPFVYRSARSGSESTAKTLVNTTSTESTVHDEPEVPSVQNEGGLKSFMDFNDDADSDTLDERMGNSGKLKKFWKKAKDGFMGKLRKKNATGKKV